MGEIPLSLLTSAGGEGAEVIYALRNNGTLALSILKGLESAGQIPRKYYQRRLTNDPSKDYYYIMRNTPNTETLIVEYGFLDNARDAAKLKANYQKYAEAVVKAVAQYGGYNYLPVGESDLYVVKRGDTLWSIARDYGLSVNELKELNNLSSNTLNVGDTLIVKKSANNNQDEEAGDEYYIVQSGDTLYSIARSFGLTVDKLKDLNSLTNNTLSIGQRLIVGKSLSNIYTVQRGDTLYSIARLYNVSVNDLKDVNNLTNNVLSIGQQLVIPSESVSNNFIYEVKKGDTLYNIAKNFNKEVSEIKSLNNLVSNVLSIGQQLIIPN